MSHEACETSSISLGRLAERCPDLLCAVGLDGQLLRVNPAWTDVVGHRSEELEGRKLLAFVHPDDVQVFGEKLAALTRGERVRFNARWRCHDGSYQSLAWCFVPSVDEGCGYGSAHVIDPSTTPNVSYTAGREKIEKRTCEVGSPKAEEQFRRLIEEAPDAIAVHRDGRFVYCNPKMVELLGCRDASELIDRPILDVVHPDDRAAVQACVEEILRTGHPVHVREQRFLRRDGSVVVAEISGIAIEYDGRPAVLAFLRDVTERKQMEQRLQQSDRLISMGMLAASVVHEINNPLAYVMANLSLMMERLRDVPSDSASIETLREVVGEITEPLNDAYHGVERVRAIAQDLKVFSRAKGDQTEPVDVCAVLESTIRMAWNAIRHRARLVKHYERVPLIMASESRLAQVFLNLLINAVQAIPEGNAPAHEIRVAVRNEKGAVVIEVSDTGVGIPPEVRERIFEPFFTTKPVGVGSGLGLSISRSIVTALGGRITVESEVGRGTTFRVTLPVPPAATPSIQPTGRVPTESLRSGTRRLQVMVVDDEPAIGAVLRRVISREHDVTVVTSGKEALERLETGAFDLVLCDLMIPDLTGMELFERVRKQKPALSKRFVFLTGGVFTPQARAFLEQVTNPVLSKPFELREIRALLQSAMTEEQKTE